MIEDNFIGIFENAFTQEFCNGAIDYFEDMKSNGFVGNRRQVDNAPTFRKNDEICLLHCEQVIPLKNTLFINSHINEVLSTCYKQYIEKFSILETTLDYGSYANWMQKTEIGGGYHIWHYESAGREVCNRMLVWMVYLNDVEEGGETEFLYQHKRVKPKTGTLLIWPAGFTHTHRGNPPLSNEKYVVTGWFQF